MIKAEQNYESKTNAISHQVEDINFIDKHQ